MKPLTPAQEDAVQRGWTDDRRVGEALVRKGLAQREIHLVTRSKRRVRGSIKTRKEQRFRYVLIRDAREEKVIA